MPNFKVRAEERKQTYLKTKERAKARRKSRKLHNLYIDHKKGDHMSPTGRGGWEVKGCPKCEV